MAISTREDPASAAELGRALDVCAAAGLKNAPCDSSDPARSAPATRVGTSKTRALPMHSPPADGQAVFPTETTEYVPPEIDAPMADSAEDESVAENSPTDSTTTVATVSSAEKRAKPV